MMRRRFELTDAEWMEIEPLLPNKVRGVPRVDDRRVLNGLLWRFRTGSPWADIPKRYGPHTTCYNHFVRRRKTGAWDAANPAMSREDIHYIYSTFPIGEREERARFDNRYRSPEPALLWINALMAGRTDADIRD